MGDFALLSEFHEVEGPVPVLSVPEHAAEHADPPFDANAFVLRCMAVDFQSKRRSREPGVTAAESDLVMVLPAQGRTAYAHHLVLPDFDARGYSRAVCVSVVTPVAGKISACFAHVHRRVAEVAALLKQGARESFLRDVEEKQRDVHRLANAAAAASGGGGVFGALPPPLLEAERAADDVPRQPDESRPEHQARQELHAPPLAAAALTVASLPASPVHGSAEAPAALPERREPLVGRALSGGHRASSVPDMGSAKLSSLNDHLASLRKRFSGKGQVRRHRQRTRGEWEMLLNSTPPREFAASFGAEPAPKRVRPLSVLCGATFARALALLQATLREVRGSLFHVNMVAPELRREAHPAAAALHFGHPTSFIPPSAFERAPPRSLASRPIVTNFALYRNFHARHGEILAAAPESNAAESERSAASSEGGEVRGNEEGEGGDAASLSDGGDALAGANLYSHSPLSIMTDSSGFEPPHASLTGVGENEALLSDDAKSDEGLRDLLLVTLSGLAEHVLFSLLIGRPLVVYGLASHRLAVEQIVRLLSVFVPRADPFHSASPHFVPWFSPPDRASVLHVSDLGDRVALVGLSKAIALSRTVLPYLSVLDLEFMTFLGPAYSLALDASWPFHPPNDAYRVPPTRALAERDRHTTFLVCRLLRRDRNWLAEPPALFVQHVQQVLLEVSIKAFLYHHLWVVGASDASASPALSATSHSSSASASALSSASASRASGVFVSLFSARARGADAPTALAHGAVADSADHELTLLKRLQCVGEDVEIVEHLSLIVAEAQAAAALLQRQAALLSKHARPEAAEGEAAKFQPHSVRWTHLEARQLHLFEQKNPELTGRTVDLAQARSAPAPIPPASAGASVAQPERRASRLASRAAARAGSPGGSLQPGTYVHREPAAESAYGSGWDDGDDDEEEDV
jgi:hypothetical protein